MKLSIIIPVYNVEMFLERCIDSIVKQDFKDYEIILVDDGSPDNCPFICDKLANDNYKIKVIHQINKGLSDARNTGIKIATGDYITFVDSDDFIGKDTLAPLLSELEKHPEYDMIEYPVFVYYGSHNQYMLNFNDAVYADCIDYWYKQKAYNHTYAWNKIYKRSIFKAILFPSGEKFEDIITFAKVLKSSKIFATTSKGLYYYCMNKDGITFTADGKALVELLSANIKVINELMLPNKSLKKEYGIYFMRLLNIQMDIYNCGIHNIYLKKIKIPLSLLKSDDVSINMKIKILTYKIIGIKGICKLNRHIQILMKHKK